MCKKLFIQSLLLSDNTYKFQTLTDVHGCQTNNKRNALILNLLIIICVSWKFSDPRCVNSLFTQTFASSEAKQTPHARIPIAMLTSVVRMSSPIRITGSGNSQSGRAISQDSGPEKIKFNIL